MREEGQWGQTWKMDNLKLAFLCSGMARGLRIHVPDGWYHVTCRRNGGERLYRTDEDRLHFLVLMAELPRRKGAEVHAFVMMGGRIGAGGGRGGEGGGRKLGVIR